MLQYIVNMKSIGSMARTILGYFVILRCCMMTPTLIYLMYRDWVELREWLLGKTDEYPVLGEDEEEEEESE